ncbi:MAG: thioredoxin [Lentisphaeria bacterium]|nr:thioredoxin [Lentisphaeria bacterium]
MSDVVHLSAEKFDEATSKGLCLVDFWAPWCGPCKMLSPILDQIAAEVGDKILIAKANVDDLPDQCVKFGVRNVPEILILRDGQVIAQLNGMQSKAKILDAINNAL